VGEVYASIHRSRGVDVRTGTTVVEWHTGGERVIGVTLSDGRREAIDMVLLGVGIEPNLEVATALGLPIAGGGVRVDEGLRAAEGVYCAGDIAFHQHPVLGRAVRVEHWQVARGHGREIGNSIARGHAPHSTLPYFWSDQYDVRLEYRGNASGLDQLVWRGDREALRFSVLYLREDVVEAVLSVNDPKTNSAAGELIKTRQRVDVAAISDPAIDLRQLAAGSRVPGG
jgi:NADPH-dependent 2,4-dienoyl-CoA reductase/sulfur reductase-like enzyme